MKAVFVCTKPLQLMVAMILAPKFADAELLLVDSFAGVEKVGGSAVLKKYFSTVSLFRTRQRALRAVLTKPYDKVFVDSDVGVRLQLTLLFLKAFRPRIRIAVYEEGIGTYRADMIPSGLKRLLYGMLGAGGYFGGSVFVNEVHCFEPERYKSIIGDTSHTVRGIDEDFLDWIQAHEEDLFLLFPGVEDLPLGCSDTKVVFLTDWNVDTSVIQFFESRSDVFVKPHPHIQAETLEDMKSRFPHSTWAPANVPAEILILYLLKQSGKVIVLHSNSSVAHYLRAMEAVKFIEIDSDWRGDLSRLWGEE